MYTTYQSLATLYTTAVPAAVIDRLIESASLFIDGIVGYKMAESNDVAPYVMYFDSKRDNTLMLPHFIVKTDTTSLKMNDVNISQEAVFYPLNRHETQYIKLRSGSFVETFAGVTIEAVRGRYVYEYDNSGIKTANDTIPSDVRFACEKMVIDVINDIEKKFQSDDIQSETIGAYSVTYMSENGADIEKQFGKSVDMLQKYKSVTIG